MAESADDPHTQSAVGGGARADGALDPPETDGADDVTVLGTAATLEAEEFPQGLSPRELALTLKGQLLGHFHLQEFIGGGGMGAVFKALDTTLDRIVAVKVVASQSVSSEDLQRRFLVEAQSTARLDHPNIARIHYVGRDRGLPYIVFEFIDGANLRDLVHHHGAVPVGDALSFTHQIAHALAHAWQKEVVHRDIKPSNILITRGGQAKLVDMGLARLRQVDTDDNELTNTGMTLGTFDYISPEQARDPRDADIRSDIYSLGCTLFYMLVGRPPFANGTAVQKLLQHQGQSPPHVSQLRGEVPESLSQLVSSMLAKSPDLRPQTPSEVVAICHDIFQELGIQAPSSLAPLPAAPRRITTNSWRSQLPWMIPLAALLLVFGVWQASDRPTDVPFEFPPLRQPSIATAVEPDESQPPVAPTTEDSSTAPSESERSSAEPTNVEAVTPRAEGKPTFNWDFETTTSDVNPSQSWLEFPAGDLPTLPEAGESTGEGVTVGDFFDFK